jgi:hypothetical protein
MIGNASVDIWQKEGVTPIVKFKDNLNIFRLPITGGSNPDSTLTPYTYAYDRPQALSRIASLRIPWHPDKGQDFTFSFTYLGFFWNIQNKTVTLHDHKCEKFLNRVNNFLASFTSGHCQMQDMMKIHGSLCHIAYIYPDGRNHLPFLSNFICSFQDNNFTYHYPPNSIITDLLWWKSILSCGCITRTLIPQGNPTDLYIFIDASTSWGIGILISQQWDAWQTSLTWKGPFCDIGWLEGVTLELLIYALEEKGLHDTHLLIHSDNQGVIGAFDKGRSRNFEVNLSIRCSASVLSTRNISLSLVYIESKENLADPILCGINGPTTDHLFSTFALPEELKPFLLHV